MKAIRNIKKDGMAIHCVEVTKDDKSGYSEKNIMRPHGRVRSESCDKW